MSHWPCKAPLGSVQLSMYCIVLNFLFFHFSIILLRRLSNATVACNQSLETLITMLQCTIDGQTRGANVRRVFIVFFFSFFSRPKCFWSKNYTSSILKLCWVTLYENKLYSLSGHQIRPVEAFDNFSWFLCNEKSLLKIYLGLTFYFIF